MAKIIVDLYIEEYAEEYPPSGMRFVGQTPEITSGALWWRKVVEHEIKNSFFVGKRLVAEVDSCGYWSKDRDEYIGAVTVYEPKYLKSIQKWCERYEDESGNDVAIITTFPVPGHGTNKGDIPRICGHCGKRAKKDDTECRGCGANI